MPKTNIPEHIDIKTNKKAENFYTDALKFLTKSNIPFMVGGTHAFSIHTGINRPTKDFDLFCKAGDYTKILELLKNAGYPVEINDARWLAKVHQGHEFIDIIFGSRTDQIPVDDTWFEHAPNETVYHVIIKIIH